MSEQWKDYFTHAFATLKERFRKSFPSALKDESQLPPNAMTLWKTVHALPCAVKVVNFRVDPSSYKFVEDNTCQLIRYDFSRFGDDSVEYVGEVAVADTPSLEGILVSHLDVGSQTAQGVAEEISREFKTKGFWDDEKPQFYYQVTFYDIWKKFDDFVDELLLLFEMPLLPQSVFEKFRVREIDFNAQYNLKPDPVTSLEENIEAASKRGYPRFSFEDLQRHVVKIRLIPQVPEDVQRVFRSAKDLHVFGYFRYHFFTISQHYGFLALESAIRHRYVQSLGGKAVLTNRRRAAHEMVNPTYRGIEDFCYRNRKAGWNARTLVINGEHFPYSMQKLLDWLVNDGLITKWERYQYDAGVYLRNSLSHLEKASVFTPGSHTLERIAYQINKLFHEEMPK